MGEARELGARVPRSHHGQAQSQDNYMPSFADCIRIIRMRDLKNCTLRVELERALETGTGIPKVNLTQISSNCVTQTDTFTYHVNDLLTTPPPSSFSFFFSPFSSLLPLFYSLPLPRSTLLLRLLLA